MSLLESLGAGLSAMGFAQLGCAHVALLGYALALNGALSTRLRVRAGGLGVMGAVGFAALMPSWAAGVTLIGLGVVAFAVFAGAAWLFAAAMGLDDDRVVHERPLDERTASTPSERGALQPTG